MRPDLKIVETNIKKIVGENLLPKLIGNLSNFEEILNRFSEVFASYNEKCKALPDKRDALSISLETLSLKQNLVEILENSDDSTLLKSFEEEFKDFYDALNTYLNELDEHFFEEQSEARFIVHEDMNFRTSLAILFKKLIWRVSKTPLSFLNLFRRDKKRIKYWNHRVPLRNMVDSHFGSLLIDDAFPIVEASQLIMNECILTVRELSSQADQTFIESLENGGEKNESEANEKVITAESDNPTYVKTSEGAQPEEVAEAVIEEIAIADDTEMKTRIKLVRFKNSISGLMETISELKDGLKTKLESILEDQNEYFLDCVDKVGTVELPGSKYNLSNSIDLRTKTMKNYNVLRKRWNTSSEIIRDTWLYQLEIDNVNYFATKEYYRLERSFEQRINSNIVAELDKLNEFIKGSRERLETFEGDDTQLRKLLLGEKITVKKDLTNDLIPRTVDFIMNQELPGLVHQTEIALKKRCDEVSTKRSIHSGDIEPPATSAKTVNVNLSQMIKFSALPEFSKASIEIKNSVFEELNQIQNFISEINQIVDFTLESSLAAQQNESEEQQDPKAIAVDGLNRALGKTKEVFEELQNLFGEVGQKLRGKTRILNDDLNKLLELENITAIRNSITSKMALEKSRKVRQNMIDWVTNIGPASVAFVSLNFKRLLDWVENLRLRFGLADVPEIISTEIADYLNATKTAIAQLPFVYQRLFQLEPMKGENFYTPRDSEMKKIQSAFSHWKNGRYAPAVVVGERGSGVTTFLHHFLKNLKGAPRVIKGEVHKIRFTEEAFLHFMGELLNVSKFDSSDEIVYHLNHLDSKRIIILEDLQHLFLKTVNGFDSLKILFELFSKTNKNVFWLTSCTSQAWDYLTKTINIPDYFAYTIQMEELSDDEIIEAIMKRHRVSGYNVVYVPSEQVKRSKRFKKLAEEEHQTYLRKEYFNRLCNFCNSNLSLAILYWLRSTKNVEGNVIHIGMEELNFNFLTSLSMEKLFTLYEILLHNGLTEHNLATIQSKSVEGAILQLLSLQDDGVIVKEDDQYEINLYLYRPIIRLLKSKNIIH